MSKACSELSCSLLVAGVLTSLQVALQKARDAGSRAA